jgi:hypothetical protein
LDELETDLLYQLHTQNLVSQHVGVPRRLIAGSGGFQQLGILPPEKQNTAEVVEVT